MPEEEDEDEDEDEDNDHLVKFVLASNQLTKC